MGNLVRGVARIRDVVARNDRAHDLLRTLRASVTQKSVACIRRNGLSGCVSLCQKRERDSQKRPFRASVSEMTHACIFFQSH